MMRRLLIIDDEAAVANLIRRIAERCGFEAISTNSSDRFMEQLELYKPDGIILDLSLPDRDGVEILRVLADAKCKAKIIIISGFDSRVLETSARFGSARGLNIVGTLMKPVPVSELRKALLELERGPEL